MKVLFAVNDERISTSIVKKYQKEYKEIISYKNVYYFNAIVKELQRDKSYDRIVISEDLEEFTSTSYAQKDKFIFDRLDNISDEASNLKGTDIPIILICSERRNKAEDILVKLFGIGIYNAIIGEDRTVDEVCRLIYKPRSKKDAKLYYKIDSENVNYVVESENDVSEIEMQNILYHFKKIGKNAEKYAESFKNIVSQYNEAQLKIIIAVLPNEVKEILEQVSPEYQSLTLTSSPNNRKVPAKNVPQKVNKVKPSKTTGTSEKFLAFDNTPAKLSKPVVVPTSLERNMYKKVSSKNNMNIDLQELEEPTIDEALVEEVVEKPKRRGRPPKKKDTQQETVPEKPKKRGRPPKKKVTEEEIINNQDDSPVLPGFEDESLNEATNYSNDSILPGFEDENNNVDTNNIYSNENILPGFEDENNDADENNVYSNDNILPGFEDDEENNFNNQADIIQGSQENAFSNNQNEDNYDNEDDYDYEVKTNKVIRPQYTKHIEDNRNLETYNNNYDDEDFENLLSSDKKLVCFVGTSKNGTSFVINTVAQILSSIGVDTAIYDATQNKSSYYIYTKNDEQLRQIASNSLENLIRGNANGIKVRNNLTVYTNVPNQNENMKNAFPIMETLIKNHSVILIDCDFDTPQEYFEKAQEIYLVQSMDVLTIQPLTAFLRELKVKNILNPNKIRIVLNKLLRIRGITSKSIVGGMSYYNDPEMSFMTELFDRNIARVVAQIPFDEDVYAKYLEDIIECEIKLNNYPKDFRQNIKNLAGVIYPLLPNNNGYNKKPKEKRKSNSMPQYSSSFSSSMNNTLNDMKKKF